MSSGGNNNQALALSNGTPLPANSIAERAMVYLVSKGDDPSDFSICTGSVISEDQILTNSHCFTQKHKFMHIKHRDNWYVSESTISFPQNKSVKSYVSDLMIAKTSKPFPSDSYKLKLISERGVELFKNCKSNFSKIFAIGKSGFQSRLGWFKPFDFVSPPYYVEGRPGVFQDSCPDN